VGAERRGGGGDNAAAHAAPRDAVAIAWRLAEIGGGTGRSSEGETRGVRTLLDLGGRHPSEPHVANRLISFH
jgi:hypothetical protein